MPRRATGHEGTTTSTACAARLPAPHQPADQELAIGEHEAPFVVYLVVWEQAVSAIQAPELIDPALSAGVPDTTRRSQVRWRPVAGRKLPGRDEDLTGLDPESIIRAFHEYNADPRRRPTLGARAHSGGEPEPGPGDRADALGLPRRREPAVPGRGASRR